MLVNGETTGITQNTINTKNYCAFYKFDKGAEITADEYKKGFNIIIDWTLYLQNNSESKE